MTITSKRNLSFHLLVLIPLLANAGCQSGRAASLAGATPGRVCAGSAEIRTDADADALASCESLEGDLRITGPVTGLRLENLRSVRYLVVAGTSLEDLSGLSGLQSAAGVTIAGNAKLTTLRGLEGLSRVEGIFVVGNESLRSLDGLDGIEHADEVVLESNPRLACLGGLHALAEATFEVSLDTHPSLSREQVNAVEQRLVASLAAGH